VSLSLNQAIIENNLDRVRELLVQGVNPNDIARWEETPLFEAVSQNRLEIVRELLAHGANPNRTSLFDIHPLFTAVANNNLEIVRELLAKGAYPNSAAIDHLPQLHQQISQEVLNLLPLHLANVIKFAQSPENRHYLPPENRNLLPEYLQQAPQGQQAQQTQQAQLIPILAQISIVVSAEQFAIYNKNECGICMDQYKNQPITLVNNCNHGFHTTCISRWIDDGGNRSCPICRKPIVSRQPISSVNSITRETFFGGGMNYLEKYQKYKNKYLQLKTSNKYLKK